MSNTIRFPIKMGVGGDECVLTDVVLASDYDRDIADLWRQLSSAMKRVARLENELRVIGYAEPQKWDADLRDQFMEWAQSRARFALAAKEPSK